MGVATSFLITLYGSSSERPSPRAWKTYRTSSPLGERTTRSNSRSLTSVSNVLLTPVAR